MFGVDLNAGRGEDHLKFFVGVTFNVSRLIYGLKRSTADAIARGQRERRFITYRERRIICQSNLKRTISPS